jgi:hypothetical protein
MSRGRTALAAVLAGALGIAVALRASAAVSYISGGAGNAEVQALKREGRSFPLNLVFTEGRRGAYLQRVKVTVADSAGTVLLDTVSRGPIMLLRLPSGTYRISAEADGRTIDRTVRVDAKGFRRIGFHWGGP